MSCDVAKNNIILFIIVFTRFEVLKTHYFPYTVHYFCSSMPRLSETRQFFTKLIVLRSETCSDWLAIRCVVIGRIPQAFDGNVTPLTVLWCHVPARRHKNNKTRYKRGICCIQRGHNYWLWWLIRLFYALPCLHLWSTSTTLHCSKLVIE